MNDRIKELVKQAGLDDDMFPIEEWDNPELEKFAELIVRECAEQADWILAEGGKTQGDLIKEHFGVEE